MHFDSIEAFGGEIYVAGMHRLAKVVGEHLEPVEVNTTYVKPLTFHRLHANDGVLWSFGTDHLTYFDGTTWHYVPHRDNP